VGVGKEAGGEVQQLLSVSVNGVSDPTPVVLVRDRLGRYYASVEQMLRWRIKSLELPSIVDEGTRYYLLNAIAGAKLDVDDAAQELRLTLPTAALRALRVDYADIGPTEEVVGDVGAFLNYEVSAERTGGGARVGGLAEFGVFTAHGVGTARVVARGGGADQGLLRLDASWTIDDPEHMRSLRVGDSISVAGPTGVPVRFAGIQLARNFAVQPGFVTFPLPSLKGGAEIPSVVDVYVNNTLRRSADVPPGPFEIADVPVVTGDGQVQLVVRDMLGRQQVISQPYYASTSLLRPGLHDYSLEAGLLRRNYGLRSNDYGGLMVSATDRYGLTDALTAAAHLEATASVQSAAAGVSAAIPRIGEIDASVGTSASRHGEGFSASVTVQRRTKDFSFGVHSEWASDAFTTIGASPGRRPPRSIIQAFAGLPAGNGSFGISYLRRDGRTEPDVQIASANWSTHLAGFGSLNIAGRTSLGGPRDTAAEVVLTIPFGFATSSSLGARLEDGRINVRAMVQKSVPVGPGFGYRLDASSGAFGRVGAAVTMRTNFADYDAQLTWVDGKTGVRLSTAGSIGLVGGHAFAARALNQSFARVQVGTYRGVRVYSDNQLVGRTGKDGSIIAPNLRAYDRNVIRIDPSDLPLDAELAADKQTVRPYARSGVVVDFAVHPARAAFLRIVLDDGATLPAGSEISVTGRDDRFVSARDGEAYLTGIEKRIEAVAEWASGRCRFTALPTPSDSSVPREVRCSRFQ
jgi:outer membrane usher protein